MDGLDDGGEAHMLSSLQVMMNSNKAYGRWMVEAGKQCRGAARLDSWAGGVAAAGGWV